MSTYWFWKNCTSIPRNTEVCSTAVQNIFLVEFIASQLNMGDDDSVAMSMIYVLFQLPSILFSHPRQQIMDTTLSES